MKKYSIYFIVLLCGIVVFFLQFDYVKKYQPYTLYQVYLDNEKIGIIDSKEELEKHISKQGNVIQEQVNDYQVSLDRIDMLHKTMKRVINHANPYYNTYNNLINLESMYNKLHKCVDKDGLILDNEYDNVVNLYNSINLNYKNNISLTTKKITNYDKLVKRIDNQIKEYEKTIVNYLYNNRDNLNLTSSEYSYLEDFVNDKLINITYSKYIEMNEYVKNNEIYLHTSDIYEPLGINIKKITTYEPNYMSASAVYDKIIDKKPCTIEGYQFRIKSVINQKLTDKALIGALSKTDYEEINNEKTNDIIIYVTDKDIFNDAIKELITVFVGKDEYEAYINNTQKEITSTGTIIDNIYLNDDITIKKTNISVKEKIYTNASDLASYLLYGDQIQTKTVLATAQDTVEDLAFKNRISVEEFFLSNPSFTSLDSIFYDGQPITITKLNPKVSLVVEESQVSDNIVNYDTVERYDKSMTVGSEFVEQKGERGLVRTTQKVHKVNGVSLSAETLSNKTIKVAKNEIIRVGTRNVPSIGSLRNWLWPTNAYTINSGFGYRSGPYGGMHYGVDIPNKKGAPVYASNNGTIVVRERHYSYGNHIVINHNNGYYSLYAHMSSFAKGLKVGSVVARGQIIGYIGMTGDATGNHVHFEIRVGKNDTNHVTNPRPYLTK